MIGDIDGVVVRDLKIVRDRRGWLAELEKVKDPWFNMATGDGLYHYFGSWLDDPSIPYAALTGHIAALKAGQQIERHQRYRHEEAGKRQHDADDENPAHDVAEQPDHQRERSSEFGKER